MNNSHDALTLQMLEWIAQGTHSYAEVIDVWKSSCPRLSIWEDACADGMVNAAPGMAGIVSLTEKGRNFVSRGRSGIALDAQAS
ncbi:hypothetical protein [Noviherbaspirillum massiliense]|uniref:hypothetical protein n=1 Tax=Noviherbaspirillum massiliense TaxID=1465823 RepID=UPI0002DA050D|nr:hypothetical protein [Noviherbaspirillum massiliense]